MQSLPERQGSQVVGGPRPLGVGAFPRDLLPTQGGWEPRPKDPGGRAEGSRGLWEEGPQAKAPVLMGSWGLGGLQGWRSSRQAWGPGPELEVGGTCSGKRPVEDYLVPSGGSKGPPAGSNNHRGLSQGAQHPPPSSPGPRWPKKTQKPGNRPPPGQRQRLEAQGPAGWGARISVALWL